MFIEKVQMQIKHMLPLKLRGSIYCFGCFRFSDLLFGGGVPDDRSVFKCCSNRGVIVLRMI